ncbi:MAG TPA: M23 family metallopeptidase [Candidatus Krumholzibacteria bacterium]|nr:M23 family metallopeptidase [Candidatus Krumholzibacteria bacterium]
MATNTSPRGLITTVVVVLVLFVGGAGLLWWQQSTPLPTAELDRSVFEVGRRLEFGLELQAARGSVRDVQVRILQGDVDALVFEDSLNTAAGRLDVAFRLEGHGLREGEALLEVHAGDDVWRPRGDADTPSARMPVMIDLTPPRLEIEAATRYPRPGGSAIAVLRSRGATEVRVEAGERDYRAYARQELPHQFLALYALPIDHPADEFPVAVAVDAAGNRAVRELPVVLRAPDVRTGSVDLSHRWLREKLPVLLPDVDTTDDQALLEGFLYVSRDLRAEAAAERDRLAAASGPLRQWEGPFLQLPNSRSTSVFGIRRTYRIDGEGLDTQVHQGYDLASTARAPIPAANTGTVVHAGPLTLYGETVVLDHGQGLLTLYGHCSSLDVEIGEQVEKGKIIARTGATGLAGGDHLHFEVVVGGQPVTPLQWWDTAWIRDHIEAPLQEAAEGSEGAGR